MERRRLIFDFGALFVAGGIVAKPELGEQRRKVIPQTLIERFKLRPAEGGYGLFVLGEDGRPYNLDDVLAALFEATRPVWDRREQQMKR